jgi:Zn-finger nucleic acid-binding protein
MPHRLCPVCRTPGRMLPESSADAVVEYYRCDTCGRVWTHRKDELNSSAKLVTTLPTTPKQ